MWGGIKLQPNKGGRGSTFLTDHNHCRTAPILVIIIGRLLGVGAGVKVQPDNGGRGSTFQADTIIIGCPLVRKAPLFGIHHEEDRWT